MTNTISLPPVLDLAAAAALKAEIEARLGAPLDVDAANVERVGGLCLQILLAASAACGRPDLGFRVVNASQAFRDDVKLMGADRLLPTADDGSAL